MIKLRVELQGMAQTIYTQITHRGCYEDDISSGHDRVPEPAHVEIGAVSW